MILQDDSWRYIHSGAWDACESDTVVYIYEESERRDNHL
jgi:hypothetical protein